MAAIATPGPGRDVRQHLVAARACRRPSRRPSRRARGTVSMPGRPRGAGEGVERRAGRGACTSRTPYAARLPTSSVVGRVADDDRVDGHAATRRRRATRAKVIVSSETSTASPSSVDLDQDEDHRASTPSCSKRSTTAGAASGPLPRTWTSLGRGGGQRPAHAGRPGRARRRAGAPRSATFLAFIRPGTRRVARLDAALEHRDHRGQRHPVGLVAVRAVAARGRPSPSPSTDTVLTPLTTGQPSS